ncbi:MAG: Na+/H+ antiporter NhaC family protein [Clostridia bacterium]|nr:Na+/H+ antiporter NhaC family protein [Clostridia bacterium]
MEPVTKKPQARASALLPILIFLVLYLGIGIFFEYIHPVDGQMGFYIMSVVLAFTIAWITAMAQDRTRTFDEKIHLCAKGIGDDNITIMIFIFLFAGMFGGIAKAAGGAASTANLLLELLPGTLAVPGMFFIASLISMSMGTSVGTVTVLVPVAVELAASTGLSVPYCAGIVLGGAMFGDNLSFISDTTIAATKTQGVDMKDKFRVNFRIALPAALVTLLIIYLLGNRPTDLGSFDYNLWQAIPYFLVLIAALCGVNVFFVLGGGTVLFFLVGLLTHSLTFTTALTAMGDGLSGMFETIIVTLLVASIGALMKANGGFEAILSFIRKTAKGRKGGMFGIAGLTGLLDIATANNTVTIVLAGPIAKEISEDYDIDPKKTASILDTVSCVFQGIIPYGAQLLVAAGLAGITSVSMMPYLYYPYLLGICVIGSILLDGKSLKKKIE